MARFGGDEFIIVLPGAGVAMARMCGQRMLDAVAAPFALQQQTLSVSASIGVACHLQHGASADALIRDADIAMYEAKKAGRGQLRFFDDAMTAHAREALIIDGALRSAIARNELQLVYQPIVTADGGQLRKVEALLRWHSAQLGMVPPDRFIPVAEDSELIVDLGNGCCGGLPPAGAMAWRDGRTGDQHQCVGAAVARQHLYRPGAQHAR